MMTASLMELYIRTTFGTESDYYEYKIVGRTTEGPNGSQTIIKKVDGTSGQPRFDVLFTTVEIGPFDQSFSIGGYSRPTRSTIVGICNNSLFKNVILPAIGAGNWVWTNEPGWVWETVAMKATYTNRDNRCSIWGVRNY